MANVFGFSTEPAGDFMPILKFDARAGRLFRVDRENTGDGFSNEPIDITSSFKAIVDFENIEVGWIDFVAGSAPDFKLVKMGEALPPRPSDRHKNGVRFILKLAKVCAGTKPVREMAGTSKAFLSGIEAVFNAYQAGKGKNAGKLPVIMLEKTTPIKSGSGERQSTNYQPTFKIVSGRRAAIWCSSRKRDVCAAATQQSMPLTTPPATGSTKVDAGARSRRRHAKQPTPTISAERKSQNDRKESGRIILALCL